MSITFPIYQLLINVVHIESIDLCTKLLYIKKHLALRYVTPLPNPESTPETERLTALLQWLHFLKLLQCIHMTM